MRSNPTRKPKRIRILVIKYGGDGGPYLPRPVRQMWETINLSGPIPYSLFPAF
jgi:hypothetical protein